MNHENIRPSVFNTCSSCCGGPGSVGEPGHGGSDWIGLRGAEPVRCGGSRRAGLIHHWPSLRASLWLWLSLTLSLTLSPVRPQLSAFMRQTTRRSHLLFSFFFFFSPLVFFYLNGNKLHLHLKHILQSAVILHTNCILGPNIHHRSYQPPPPPLNEKCICDE